MFTGRLYFDFVSDDVFRVYRLIADAQQQGAEVALEWRGFPVSATSSDRLALAASELVRSQLSELHGAFVQAVLVAVHLEGAEASDDDVLALAARVAGIDPQQVTAERVATRGIAILDESVAEAEALGVRGVPSLYRHGPPVLVRTTPAVVDGSSLRRLEMIDTMLDDDGLWELSKP